MPSSNGALTAPRTRPAPTQSSQIQQGPTKEIPTPQARVPSCPQCGTDNFLTYSSYLPTAEAPDGGTEPARAFYTCTRCGTAGGHEVPAGWRPPGWFYCT